MTKSWEQHHCVRGVGQLCGWNELPIPKMGVAGQALHFLFNVVTASKSGGDFLLHIDHCAILVKTKMNALSPLMKHVHIVI